MLVCYLRSSSIGTLSFCENKYLMTYNLGMKDKENLKALMGTVVHRCMETLGDIVVARRAGKRKVKNEIFNHTFKQLEDLELISKLCYDYYKKHSPTLAHKFKPSTYKTIHEWFLKALAFRGGEMDPRNQNIFAVEQFFDIEIKKPWAKYRYDIDGEVIEGNLSIKGTVDVIVQHDKKYFQILDYKGLPLDTPLLTTDGWTTMGDIQVGDTVYDRFGKQTKVTVKSRVKYRDCYKITFDDKTVAECDDEHYWTLSDNSVVQAPDLVEGMKIDVAKPIENDELDLPVDPYLLGVWLGDGRKRGCEITCGDTQVFKEIENRGYCLGVDQYRNNSERNCECRIVKDTTHKLRSLGLLDNKHIPEIYFKASHNQRLDLLRGLMDSDGSVNPLRKQCVFMNTNKKLSEDTCYLLRTLGQRPYLCTTKQTYKGSEYNCYPVHFRPVDIRPFNIDRKNNKIDPNWGAGASSQRRITKIEKVGKKKTQCISVDSTDSTYLCTKNLIPTHNTGKRIDWASGEVKTQAKLEKDVQLLLYYYALKNLFPDYEFYVSIYYINDSKIDGVEVKGGLFDIVFDESDYEKAESIIRQKFEYIQSIKQPKLLSDNNSHWKCKYLCAFSEQYKDTEKTVCQHIRDEVKAKGCEQVIAEYGNGLTHISTYGSGGGKLSEDDKKTE